jgi:hypothetical protein
MNVNGIKVGDLVKGIYYVNRPEKNIYGIVTHTQEDRVEVITFNWGLPRTISQEYKFFPVVIDEVLANYDEVNNEFERTFQQGGIVGAIASVNQYPLQKFLSRVRDGALPLSAIKDLPSPETGHYVVGGVYCGNGPSKRHLQGLIINPRISADKVSGFLEAIFHDEQFGNIPDHSNTLEATSGGDLVGYYAHEVPPKAEKLVKENTIRIRVEIN